MIITQIDRTCSDIKKIEKLYNRSFPDDERIPFSHLLNTLSSERIMHAYYEGHVLIGMTFVFLKDDMVYLSYICVADEIRNKGYGTEILKAVQHEFSAYRIVIDIEELKPESDNYEERVRRRNFYLHNGFVSCDVFYHIYSVDYELLSWNGKVHQEEWHSIIRKHWGRFADTAIYRKKE